SLLEKRRLSLQRIIHSLPAGASSSLQHLDPAIPLFKQTRPCDFCGATIIPKKSSVGLVRFCNQSCSTKWNMQFKEVRERMFTPERAKRAGEGRRKFLLSGSPAAKVQMDRIRNLNPMSN